MRRPRKKSTFSSILLGGCGAAALVVLAIAASVAFVVWKKSNDYLSRPALFEAERAVLEIPGLEIASVDPAKGTITVRHRGTGETLVLAPEDIMEGKFGFASIEDGGGANADAKGGGAPQRGEGAAVPEGIVTYPGAPLRIHRQIATKGKETGTLEQETGDSVASAQAALERALGGAGYRIVSAGPGPDGVLIQAENEARGWAMAIFFAEAEGGGTKIILEYRRL